MKEFFELASIWLDCRWHNIHLSKDHMWSFLGEMDFQTEMYLLLEEMKEERGKRMRQ